MLEYKRLIYLEKLKELFDDSDAQSALEWYIANDSRYPVVLVGSGFTRNAKISVWENGTCFGTSNSVRFAAGPLGDDCMKIPTNATVLPWLESIARQGYRRIKLRALLKAFGAKRRGPALIAGIDEVLAECQIDGEPCPLKVEWGRALDLDDSVRIVPGDSAGQPTAPRPRPKAEKKAKPAAPRNSGEIIRAISIRQPYVEAILLGKKTIEYRSRKTNIRECVYIYASAKPGEPCYGLVAEGLPTGVIVGTIDIVDCTGVEGDYEIHLANPKRLDKHLKAKNQPQPMFWRPQLKRGAK